MLTAHRMPGTVLNILHVIQCSKLPRESAPSLHLQMRKIKLREGYLQPQSKNWQTRSMLHQRTGPRPTGKNQREARSLHSELSKRRKGIQLIVERGRRFRSASKSTCSFHYIKWFPHDNYRLEA